MKRSYQFVPPALLVLCACSGADFADGTEGGELEEGLEIAEVQQDLYYQSEYLWPRPFPVGVAQVKVCWLNQAGTTEAGWVQDAVERTWETASGLDYVGWDDCDNYRTTSGGKDTYNADVRIRVSSSYWPSSLVGTEANSYKTKLSSESEDKVASMRMNFFTTKLAGLDGCESTAATTGPTGKVWPSARQQCIEAIAAHEFGHASGIAHEQNRPDTPASCTASDDGYGNTSLGNWDQVSIMNYCAPVWNNDAYLSAFDISGMQSLYGQGSFDYLWYMLGNGPDIKAGSDNGFYLDLRAHDISGTYGRAFAGDFNGDGESDIFWYAAGTSNDHVWWGRTNRAFTSQGGWGVDGTYMPVVGRFNDDAYDDVYWYGPGSAADRIWFGKADKTFDTSITAKAHSRAGTFQPLAGDFDGDGHTDIFWYQAGSGADYIWWGNGGNGSFTEVAREVTGTYRPLVGDFDGDSYDDIMWYGVGNAADGTWWGKANRTFTSASWGGSVSGTYDPIVGDFDGNGATDIYWNRGAKNDPVWLGQVGVRSPNSFTSDVQGNYKAIVGDYDGNGMDDIFWYWQDTVVK